MIDVRSLASSAVGIVNPPRFATLRVSAGYTTTLDGTQVPAYTVVTNVQVDVQALSERDVAHLSGLNVGGSTHVLYLGGRLDSVVRALQKGGDLLDFDGRRWLVTAVMENWPTWSKVAVTLQNDPPT